MIIDYLKKSAIIFFVVLKNNQYTIDNTQYKTGGLAQLARASALHAEGQRFDSVILHQKTIWKLANLKIENNNNKSSLTTRWFD